jgi:hypothetical protein
MVKLRVLILRSLLTSLGEVRHVDGPDRDVAYQEGRLDMCRFGDVVDVHLRGLCWLGSKCLRRLCGWIRLHQPEP